MTIGNKTYDGLAVPINGEHEITQETGTIDISTLTRASGGTGDFFVCRDDGGTEYFSIKSDGGLNFTAGARLSMGRLATVPTTGLTKGDLFLMFTGSRPVLAACSSSAANTVKYISGGFNTKTIGRST